MAEEEVKVVELVCLRDIFFSRWLAFVDAVENLIDSWVSYIILFY